LSALLAADTPDHSSDMSKIASDVCSQVLALGQTTPQQSSIKSLLWKSHNLENISRQWNNYGGPELLRSSGIAEDPIEFFQKLSADEMSVAYTQQAFSHGDLNTSNIIVDLHKTPVEAYIFDAAGAQPHVNIRDIAHLEVSALIHHPPRNGRTVIEECASVYGGGYLVDIPTEAGQARNVISLVTELRRTAAQSASELLYAVSVVDYALLQLGGLSYGPSMNKIGTRRDAALLVALTLQWFKRIRV